MAPDRGVEAAVWDWLDDGYGRRSDMIATGLLGDYATVQIVIRDGDRWLVTAPWRYEEPSPRLAHETPLEAIGRAAAERTRALFPTRAIGRVLHWRLFGSAVVSYAVTLALTVGAFVGASLGVIVAARWAVRVLDAPEWVAGKLAVTLAACLILLTMMVPLVRLVVSLPVRRAQEKRRAKDAERFASSTLSSGRTWSLTGRQGEDARSLIDDRSNRIRRVGKRNGDGIDDAMIWWLDLGRGRYRRSFGPLSPALRVAFLPCIRTGAAPRRRYADAVGNWLCSPIFIGMCAIVVIAGAKSITHYASVLSLGVTAASALITVVGLAPLLILRARLRRRWRERAETRRRALLDVCEKVLAGRRPDLSANGRRFRWLDRMRAYV